MRRGLLGEGRRIFVLCEGNTEEVAIDKFIGPQWDADGLRSIGLQTVNLAGKLEDIPPYVRRLRDEMKVRAVFTLIDLYGMERVSHKDTDEVSDKVARVKQWLRADLDNRFDSFFYPHVSVHELEAWLLAEGKSLGGLLKATIPPNRNAESLDLDDPPSKRIDRLFKNHGIRDGYQERKLTYARRLFERLEFESVYSTCRYFREFYDALKGVGLAALS